MNIFKKFRASLRLFEAIRQADKAYEETGERHYVMPTSGKSGQLIIMDRKNFRKLKHKGYITKEANIGDLEKECFYCTPYRNGEGAMPDMVAQMKKQEYFKWIDSLNGKVRKH